MQISVASVPKSLDDRPQTLRRMAGVVCAMLIAGGCDADSERSSLGSSNTVEEWFLDANPLFVIGADESRAMYHFSGIVGGLLLSDSSIAVADRVGREIRLFSRRGEFVRSFGRMGAGPGEFAALTAISAGPTDGVCAWDRLQGRVTCFDVFGQVEFTASVDVPFGGSTTFLGMFADSSSVFESRGVGTREMKGLPSGRRRDPAHYLRFSSSGDSLGAVATAPGLETFFVDDGVSWKNHEVLFGYTALAHLNRDLLTVATNDSLEARQIRSNGRLVSTLTRSRERLPVTARMALEIREEMLAEIDRVSSQSVMILPPGRREEVDASQRRQIEAIPSNDWVPGFTDLRTDELGWIWIKNFADEAAEAVTWDIFSPDGGTVSKIAIPRGVHVLAVSPDALLVKTQDELDRDLLALYEVRRSH